jgi:hypothetical protein
VYRLDVLGQRAEPGGGMQRLADGEQPDDDHDDADAVEQFQRAEGEPGLPGQRVDPDQPEEQPEHQ